MTKMNLHEERITLWKATAIDVAIELAEKEAESYASDIKAKYLGLAQAYYLFDQSDSSGIEVYSLVRDSDLGSEEYMDTFFDTGNERQK